MKCLRLLPILVLLCGLPPGVAAGDLWCLAENGERYQTQRATCPPEQEEVKKKIVSCVLPDGSRAFGDKCPAPGAKQQALDAEQLGNRSKGSGGEDINRVRRGLQQLDAQKRQEQMTAEQIAAQRREFEAQEQYQRELRKRQEEQLEAKKRQEEQRRRSK